jgi:hypothetical protein
MSTSPRWVSAFLDFAPGDFDRGVEFWSAVTGYGLSARRGEREQFATLVPPDGDGYLHLQHLADGPGRMHLDLHVTEPTVAAEAAIELGAHVLVRHEEGYVVVRSPGGLVFCFVAHPGSVVPTPVRWPDGRSQVDQVCLDIPPSRYDVEVEFWQALTGWELDPDVSREFARLDVPDDQPLRWLIQRLDDEQPAVTAHLDLSSDDRDAEVARHVALGATAGHRFDWWTALTDPVGTAYCVTRRTPR